MTLRVSLSDLSDFAGDCDTLSAAAKEATVYAAHTKPEASGGSAFVRFLNSTAEVRPTVEAFFEHLTKLTAMSADEIVATRKYYRDTDHTSAVRADAKYKAVADTPIP